MARWNSDKRKFVETPKIDLFLAEVTDVCRKHGFAIGHEDRHGAFVITKFDLNLIRWLNAAKTENKLDIS